MTTKDDSFNASDIDYLESRLIDLAGRVGRSDSENKKRGNPKKVDEFRQAELEQYLEEALFLLELVGVRVFKREPRKRINTPKQPRVDKPGAKPALPDLTLGPCVFAKTALEALLESGYRFTDEQVQLFGTIEGSKTYTTRNLPLFWLLKDGESRASCEKNIRARYWKDEFVSGKYRFLMYSQWYDDPRKGATKENFIKWYESL